MTDPGAQGSEPLPVYTLGGKGCLAYGIPCVQSFVRYFREPALLHWLDDGTLDDADIKLISAAIPGCRVIRHAEATERVAAFFAQRPACLRLRNKCVNNRQIMDPLALSEIPFLYFDTDIYFQRPFIGLARLLGSSNDTALVHSTDVQNAYKIRMRSLFGPGRLKLLARVNSGFFALSPSAAIADHVEELLTHRRHARMLFEESTWTVQTIVSSIGRAFGARAIAFEHLALPAGDGSMGNEKTLRDAIGIHYVRPVRHQLIERLKAGEKSPRISVPLNLATVPSQHFPLLQETRRTFLQKMARFLQGK